MVSGPGCATDRPLSDQTSSERRDNRRMMSERRVSERRRAMEHELIDRSKTQAADLWDYARRNAETALEVQQRAAADSLGDVAQALRTAGRELEQHNKPGASGMVRHAADSLESLAGTLHTKNLGAMAQDMAAFARRQPAAFLGTAIALGFLATRFIKSSSVDRSADSREPGTRSDSRHLH